MPFLHVHVQKPEVILQIFRSKRLLKLAILNAAGKLKKLSLFWKKKQTKNHKQLTPSTCGVSNWGTLLRYCSAGSVHTTHRAQGCCPERSSDPTHTTTETRIYIHVWKMLRPFWNNKALVHMWPKRVAHLPYIVTSDTVSPEKGSLFPWYLLLALVVFNQWVRRQQLNHQRDGKKLNCKWARAKFKMYLYTALLGFFPKY